MLEQYIAGPFRPDDLVIDVEVAAVCRLDTEVFEGRQTRLLLDKPAVLGHEYCGVVVHPGKSDLELGSRVSVVGTEYCGTCRYCRKNQSLLCTDLKIRAGGYAQRVAIPNKWIKSRVILVPRDSDPVAAAYIDSIACVARALRVSRLQAGEKVYILGGGFLSALTALALQVNGFSVIVFSASGASHKYFNLLNIPVNGLEGGTMEDHPGGADVVIDWGGTSIPGLSIDRMLDWGGRYVCMSATSTIRLPSAGDVYKYRWTFLHSFHNDSTDRKKAVSLLPVISDYIRILSRAFPLESTEQALRLMVAREQMRCHILVNSDVAADGPSKLNETLGKS